MDEEADNQPPPEIRDRIADYAMLRRIGAGAYGDVWLARDAVGKHVAVKTIDRGRLALISRTNREERAVGILRTNLPEHPNVIRIHHVGNSGPHLYYVMDLADDLNASADATPHVRHDPGGYCPHTLADDLARRGAIPIDESIAIIRQILVAVAFLHEHGVIHRDIKPSNILRIGGVWKLADIGLLAPEATLMTTVGTPDFMPPNGAMDRSADSYALGKTLYCMFTGLPPRSFPTIPKAILASPLKWAASELNDVVNRACHPQPAKRFQSVGEFTAALDAAEARIAGGVKNGPRQRRIAWVAAATAAVATVVATYTWYTPPPRRPGTSDNPAQVAPNVFSRLFNGQDLSGWHKERPFHGNWAVRQGRLTCERTAEFKKLTSDQSFGAGTYRVTVIPGHEGARIGIGYVQPYGPLFMLMGDKYTWMRGDKSLFPSSDSGNWLSFPGPIPKPGEAVVMEVEYGPAKVILRVNGTTLQEITGEAGMGRLCLHVWGDDAGSFKDIEFRPIGVP